MQPKIEEAPKARTGRGPNSEDNRRQLASDSNDKPKQAVLHAVRATSARHCYLYDVEFSGETIVTRSTDPECEMARALLARGVTGVVQIIDCQTGRPRSLVNIVKAAKLRTREGRGAPHFTPFETSPERAPTAEADLYLANAPGERKAA